MTTRSALVVLPAIGFFLISALQVSAADDVDFSRDIRPILVEKCYSCHGPDEAKRETDMRLDSESSVFAERDPLMIVRGKPEESELYRRLTTDDEFELMPPPDSRKIVSDGQKALFKKWIEQGAPWAEHWAYAKLVRPAIPKTPAGDFVRNEIDHFTLARMQAEGLTSNPAADRITLIRRLSFDLIGLPPTPAEVDAFVQDSSPGVYEKLVDRLLGSKHYGEPMAIYWLDAARYADTRQWVDDRMEWLTSQFGEDALQTMTVAIPTRKFFPDPYEPSEPSLETLLGRMRNLVWHMILSLSEQNNVYSHN